MAVLARKNPKRYCRKNSKSRARHNQVALSSRQQTALVKRVKKFGATNINVCLDEVNTIEYIKGLKANGKE